MASTYTFPASNVAKAAIVVQGPCTQISIREDASVANWPTQNIQLFRPLSSSPAVTFLPGEWIILPVESRFMPGQTIGYIQTASGATTMAQKED